MSEVEISMDTPVSPLLHAPGALGKEPAAPGEIEAGGFFARTQDQPIAVPLDEIFSSFDMLSGRTGYLFERFRVWLVPHGFSIVRRRGFAEAIAVGVEVRYLNAERPCSVQGLIPSFQFLEHGRFTAKVSLHGELEGSEGGLVSGIQRRFLGLDFTLTSSGSLVVGVSVSVATPYIAATGAQSSRCEWRFDRHKEPLYGRDIQTWSAVALPKRQRELEFETRFYFVARTFVVPSRWQSAFTRTKCKLQ